MSKKLVTVASFSSLALISGLAYATAPAYPSNPEHSFAAYGAPAPISRTEVRKELADFQRNPVSGDRWKYVGGERGSAPIPHTFAYVAGELVHTDVCDHSAKGQKAATNAGRPQYTDLYKSAE